MPTFFLPYRWRQQPQIAQDINWNHPLALNLSIALNFGDPRCFMGLEPINLATGGRLTVGGSTDPDRGAGALGRWYGKGNSNQNYLVVDKAQPAEASTLFVVLANNNGAGLQRTAFTSQDGTNDNYLGVNNSNVPQIATAASVRCTGVTVGTNQAIGYQLKNQDYKVYQNGTVTGTGSANGGNGATTHLLGLTPSVNTKSSRVYCLYVWQRVLSEGEHFELALAPWQFFKPLNRRIYVLTSPALNVDIDTAGSVTVEGQSATLTLGVALNAGAVSIAGQSAAVDIGLAVGQAGSITVAGQTAAVALGANIAQAGSITIGGEDVTLALTADRFLTIDTPGSVTIQGQEVDLALEGDLNLSIDAGSITIEGQQCDLVLQSDQAGGAAKSEKRRRRKLRPDELEPLAVEVNFLQPWQTCSATVEVTGELAFGFAQEGSLLNANAESVEDVSIEVRQEVAELIASLQAMPLRSGPVKVMPKTETARVRVAVGQPAHELSATVEIG